jgi:hypothetical protein
MLRPRTRFQTARTEAALTKQKKAGSTNALRRAAGRPASTIPAPPSAYTTAWASAAAL